MALSNHERVGKALEVLKAGLPEYAWCGDFLGGLTHAVGQKRPNAYRLHDLYGNVSEWCQDWLGAYPGGSVTDPQGPSVGDDRVFRGGGWGDFLWNCRSASRSGAPPDFVFDGVGFRVVLSPIAFRH